VGDRLSGRDRWGREGSLLLWWALPPAALLLVAPRYSHAWYFYDEWSVINALTAGPIDPSMLLATYNGHLFAVPYLVYAAQVLWLGMSNHLLVWTVHCLALLGLSYAVAGLLRTLRVPALLAVLAGITAAYFGPGAQLAYFEILFSVNLVLALTLLAAIVAFRHRSGTWRAALGISALLMAATLTDGGIATIGVVYLALILLRRWPPSLLIAAIVPAGAIGVWAALAQPSPSFPADLPTQASVAARLLLLAAGGLLGGGARVGAIALVLAAVLLAVGHRRGLLGPDQARALVAGSAAAAIAAIVIAHARAGLITPQTMADFNRYVGQIAVFLLVALLPAVWAVASGLLPRWRTVLVPTFAAGMVVAFLLNLGGLNTTRYHLETWYQQSTDQVPAAIGVARLRCPSGRAVGGAFAPLGYLGPTLTVELLRRLSAAGILDIAAVAPDAALAERACAFDA
jgi:hypothetical protein